MKKKRGKILILCLAFLFCMSASYLIIDHIPASYVQFGTEEQKEGKSCVNDNQNHDRPAVNILFAVDSGYISSDCNTANTIVDTAGKIFASDFSEKNDISVEVCTFSSYSSLNKADVVSSEPLRCLEDVECYISYIKKYFGAEDKTSACMMIPV